MPDKSALKDNEKKGLEMNFCSFACPTCKAKATISFKQLLPWSDL